LATRSPRHKDSTRTGPPANSPKSAAARVSDLLLLEELHAHLPVGLLVTDAETLEILHANPPLPGFGDRDLPLDPAGRVAHRGARPAGLAAPAFASLLQEVAATGRPRHLREFSHESSGQEPRWWSAIVHLIETDGWGRVLVMLAVDLTDQVRARHLLEERERRQLALRQTIAAVPGHNLTASLQQVADGLVAAFPADVAALRLIDTEAKLHLVAAAGFRPAEIRRLGLEPLDEGRIEAMIDGSRHPLVGSLGLRWVEIRWLTARDDRVGALTIGARSETRPSEDDLALLDAAAAQVGSKLERIERSPRLLRSRSLELARASAQQDDAGEARVRSLRRRELAILRLYGEGLETRQIAELLVLSPHTVRAHTRNARRRLGVSSRREALDLLRATETDPVI
jgi:DNA-binding CsgD family transcriptional regulator